MADSVYGASWLKREWPQPGKHSVTFIRKRAATAWGAVQRTHKDLNGVGGRQRRFEKNVVLALLINAEKREARMLLAQFLKDP